MSDRLARLLIRLCVAPGEREAILGDLDEARQRVTRDVGSRAARRWYLRQAGVAAAYGVGDRGANRGTGASGVPLGRDRVPPGCPDSSADARHDDLGGGVAGRGHRRHDRDVRARLRRPPAAARTAASGSARRARAGDAEEPRRLVLRRRAGGARVGGHADHARARPRHRQRAAQYRRRSRGTYRSTPSAGGSSRRWGFGRESAGSSTRPTRRPARM